MAQCGGTARITTDIRGWIEGRLGTAGFREERIKRALDCRLHQYGNRRAGARIIVGSTRGIKCHNNVFLDNCEEEEKRVESIVTDWPGLGGGMVPQKDQRQSPASAPDVNAAIWGLISGKAQRYHPKAVFQEPNMTTRIPGIITANSPRRNKAQEQREL